MKEAKEMRNINVRDVDFDVHNKFRTLCVSYDVPMTEIIRTFISDLELVKKVIENYKNKK